MREYRPEGSGRAVNEFPLTRKLFIPALQKFKKKSTVLLWFD